MASVSLTRAHHLKHQRKYSSTNTNTTTTQVYAKSYGGYSIDLSFGTPPQKTPFILDTGSSLTWFPCTLHYVCSHCSSIKIKPFLPKLSSTAKLLGCTNPKCSYLYPSLSHCTQTCPPYIVQYGSGSTAGLLLLDNLHFPKTTVHDFLVGCSILSTRQPSGIAGFGRGNESLPSQMALKRFSYCLISHNLDDSPQTSDLLLQTTSSGDTKTQNLTYTPFSHNPSSNNSAYKEYYYLPLRKLLVGPNSVNIPLRYLEPDSQGNGGTIVDSGTTYTYMERPIYDSVSREFLNQLGNYSRAKGIEAQSGLSPCYHVSGVKNLTFPSFTLQFKGGAKMKLPLANYFSLIENSDVVCFTVVSDDATGPANMKGPAVILGNYQQQNFFIEFDLENERFGFRHQSCNKKH